MESRLKNNFFKRKIVENLNFMHSLDDLATEILYTGSKIRPKETLPISDSYNQVKTIDYV